MCTHTQHDNHLKKRWGQAFYQERYTPTIIPNSCYGYSSSTTRLKLKCPESSRLGRSNSSPRMRLPTCVPMLLVFLVSHRLTVARLWPEEQLPRSLGDNIIYRPYQSGDDTTRVDSSVAESCADNPCFVAVDTSISKKAVIGDIIMHIPAIGIMKRVKDAIVEQMPEPSKHVKNGVIGYIAHFEVYRPMRGQKIGTKLLTETFKYLGQTRPKLVAMYLAVEPDNLHAIHLYEKSDFVKLKYEDGWFLFYARYKMKETEFPYDTLSFNETQRG